MKVISKQFLSDAVSNFEALISSNTIDAFTKGSIFPSDQNPIVELYTNYSALEIDKYDKIISSTNEFFEFLTNSKIYETDEFAKFLIDQARLSIIRMINKFAYENLGQKFASTVFTLSPTSPNNAHILDVGPGKVPYSSLSLATSTKKVSAMDESFLFANESLRAMNVNPLETYFDKNTNTDDFDFVVGSYPCSAIPYIVSKCSKENKPYFLKLCDCAINDKTLEILDEFAASGMYSWKKILPVLDPKIKFFDDYAFNIEASPEQVKRVLASTHSPHKNNILPTITASQLTFDISDTNISFAEYSANETSWSKE